MCLAPEVEQRLRRTHETFYCPFGHGQSFTGENETEKLKRRVAMLEGRAARWEQMWREVSETFGTCPLCGWRSLAATQRRWLYMLRHFDRAHSDLTTVSLVWALRDAERKAS